VTRASSRYAGVRDAGQTSGDGCAVGTEAERTTDRR